MIIIFKKNIFYDFLNNKKLSVNTVTAKRSYEGF
jgi:hypothetical protein